MPTKMCRSLFAITVFVVTCASASAQEREDSVGYVAAAEGSPTLQRGDEQVPAAEGMLVGPDDRILTGPAGRVLLILDDGSRIVIGPETQIALVLLVDDGDPATGDQVIELLQGILRITLQSPADAAGVQTRSPTAVVAARSTVWIVEYAADNTAVLALEGSVEVGATTAEGSVVLLPGEGTDVALGAPPSEPVEWGAARVDDVRERTTFSGIR